jgi:hypothetical protein
MRGLTAHSVFEEPAPRPNLESELCSSRACGSALHELRKAKGASKFKISSAAFDLKFLVWTRGELCRNFKSAALAPHAFAVRLKRRSAARRQSAHRIPRLTSVTITIRPSCEREAG